MSCNLTEKISMLIDGALSNQEAAQTHSHLAACAECRLAMTDFLRLREALKGSAAPLDDVTQRRALNRIFSSGRTGIWNRRVLVPAPAMAMLLITLVGLAVWSVVMLFSRPTTLTRVNHPSGAVDAGQPPLTEVGLELSRLDHGGRPVIIKVRKGSGAEAQEPGRANQ